MKQVAAIVIGRNEGARLTTCLKSLQGVADPIVYVDSGSTDGSIENATALGAHVVSLDLSVPFTAARARNAGMAALGDDAPMYVQLVDGDCEVQPSWVPTAAAFLDVNPYVAIVAGRLRERHPDATIWNQLADDEWATTPGEVAEIGGISLVRRKALAEIDGFRESLIAGEEPEMCLRLRRLGWKIWRLEDEMALHDIAMTRFGQWWTRSKRSGHAYAEGAALHGDGPERYRIQEVRRIMIWGAIIPLFIIAGSIFVSWLFVLGALIYPLQIVRLSRRMPLRRAFFLTIAKFAEAQGVIASWIARRRGKQQKIVEYK